MGDGLDCEADEDHRPAFSTVLGLNKEEMESWEHEKFLKTGAKMWLCQ